MTAPELTADLMAVLRDAHAALEASERDGASGQTPGEVAAQVEQLARSLRAGYSPDVAGWLFAPTGDLQEVANANGWGEACLATARRAEAAQAARVATYRPRWFHLPSLTARVAPVAVLGAALLAAAWRSGRLVWTLVAGAGAAAVFGPVWFVWLFKDGVLNTTPLWTRFWDDLARPSAATWLLTRLGLGLIAAVACVARGLGPF